MIITRIIDGSDQDGNDRVCIDQSMTKEERAKDSKKVKCNTWTVNETL